VRASRLVELLVWLQLRGGAPAPALAEALGVSVRTVYRDVEALSAAGVPVWTETGRNGGVRLDPSYRVAGLPRLDAEEARAVLFAAVPVLAQQLGLEDAAVEQTLLPAMTASAETAARAVRERLLVDPSHWFVPTDDVSALAELSRAVWESRVVDCVYRDEPLRVRPLGLVLKGSTWYAVVRAGPTVERPFRLLRLSRVRDVEVRAERFVRPSDFDLGATWSTVRADFLASLPAYPVVLRVPPEGEWVLRLLDEGVRPPLPLPDDVERDPDGAALVTVDLERIDRAARQVLRLGPDVEVLAPSELRDRLAADAARLVALYGGSTARESPR
jgi:predicted DNA-binding transcriptional regulator YafY